MAVLIPKPFFRETMDLMLLHTPEEKYESDSHGNYSPTENSMARACLYIGEREEVKMALLK
jgi:hypothetical protein